MADNVVYVSQQTDEQGNQDPNRTEETLTYLVEFSGANVTGDDAMSADDGTTSIPQVNDLVNGKRVQTLDYQRDRDNPHIFTVKVKLSDAQDQKDTQGEVTEVSIEIAAEKYEEPVYLDINKHAIVNTAGQPFTNEPTKTYYDQKVTVTFKTAKVDQVQIDKCIGKLNSGKVTMTIKGYERSFAQGTLKFSDYSIGATVVQKAFWWQMRYEFLYRADGWSRKILNMGQNELISGKLRGIILGTGPATGDVPLDIEGRAIKTGVIGVAKAEADADVGDLMYREFVLEAQANFGALLQKINNQPQYPQ